MPPETCTGVIVVDALIGLSLRNFLCNESWAAAGADVGWRSMLVEEHLQDFLDLAGADRGPDAYALAFASVLIHYGKELQLPAALRHISGEVERPYIVPLLRLLAKGTRPRFTAEYKLKTLEEAAACGKPGAIAALIRREGLYSSHLTSWRKARRSGALGALEKRRGPKGRRRDPVMKETEKLRLEVARLEQRLRRAEVILEKR